jgi:predicted nucleotidyltransferase
MAPLMRQLLMETRCFAVVERGAAFAALENEVKIRELQGLHTGGAHAVPKRSSRSDTARPPPCTPPMHPLTESNREAIADLCRRHGVRKLEVFGSILRDDFDAARSDVDVLVDFQGAAKSSFGNFLALKESLEVLFGRPVDLRELDAIANRRLRRHIERSKMPLYAAA